MIILLQLPWYSRTFINSNSTNSVLCDTLAHCAKRIRKWISEGEMCHCANRIFSVTSVISHCAKRILIFFIGEHPLRKKNFQIWWSLRILRIFASLRKKNLSFQSYIFNNFCSYQCRDKGWSGTFEEWHSRCLPDFELQMERKAETLIGFILLQKIDWSWVYLISTSDVKSFLRCTYTLCLARYFIKNLTT